MNRDYLLTVLLFFLLFSGCNLPNQKPTDIPLYNGNDPRAYLNSPAMPLVNALDKGRWRVAKEEIRKNPSIVNYCDSNYRNPILYWAALNSNYKAVKLLLDAGADVNRINIGNESPLDVAAYYIDCDSPILQMMLEHQNEKDSLTQILRNEALVRASASCLSNVKLLVKYGANPLYVSQKDLVFENYTALAEAIVQGNYDIAAYYIIELGVDPKSGGIVNNRGDSISAIEQLKKSYKMERTFDEDKTRSQIKRILDFLERQNK